MFKFVQDALGVDPRTYPALSGLSARCEALPAFQAVKADFYVPAQA